MWQRWHSAASRLSALSLGLWLRCAQASTTGVHAPCSRMFSVGRRTRRPWPLRQQCRFRSHHRPSRRWNILCPCGRPQCSQAPPARTKRTWCEICCQSIGCQRHCKNPRKWQSKIPHFRFWRSGGWWRASIFGWAPAAAWFDECGRSNWRVCPDVLRQEIGMAAQAIA